MRKPRKPRKTANERKAEARNRRALNRQGWSLRQFGPFWELRRKGKAKDA